MVSLPSRDQDIHKNVSSRAEALKNLSRACLAPRQLSQGLITERHELGVDHTVQLDDMLVQLTNEE